MSWRAHRATFECPVHPHVTARDRRAVAFEGKAPLCPRCALVMRIKDVDGLTEKAKWDLICARGRQIDTRAMGEG